MELSEFLMHDSRYAVEKFHDFSMTFGIPMTLFFSPIFHDCGNPAVILGEAVLDRKSGEGWPAGHKTSARRRRK